MSVLQTHVIKRVNQHSPVFGDVERVVRFGDDGEEFVSYEPTDYSKIRESHGTVKMWSLDSLIKAGIDPNFKISTGLTTRLEGDSIVNSLVDEADKVLAADNVEPSNN